MNWSGFVRKVHITRWRKSGPKKLGTSEHFRETIEQVWQYICASPDISPKTLQYRENFRRLHNTNVPWFQACIDDKDNKHQWGCKYKWMQYCACFFATCSWGWLHGCRQSTSASAKMQNDATSSCTFLCAIVHQLWNTSIVSVPLSDHGTQSKSTASTCSR